MKYLSIMIAATLLAACQSGGASSGGTSSGDAPPGVPTDKSRDAAERDRKINNVQEQIRNMQH